MQHFPNMKFVLVLCLALTACQQKRPPEEPATIVDVPVNAEQGGALSGGPADGSRVEVKRSLLKEGKRLTVLNTETATRENGTWENTLTFAVPDSATPGRYAVLQEISARGLTRTTQRPFTVR